MLYVKIHAAWMILAVAVGTVAGYQGLLRATQRQDGRSLLPGRFLLRSHVRWGTVFYLMLCAGILFGRTMYECLGVYVFSHTISDVHLVLALGIGILYAVAWAVGLGLVKEPAGQSRARPRIHMVLNFIACAGVLVQIVLAIYYVWFWVEETVGGQRSLGGMI